MRRATLRRLTLAVIAVNVAAGLVSLTCYVTGGSEWQLFAGMGNMAIAMMLAE